MPTAKHQLKLEMVALINSLKEHAVFLEGEHDVSALEVEFILSKVKKLHERSVVFSYLNTLDESRAQLSLFNQVEQKEVSKQTEIQPEITEVKNSQSTIEPMSSMPVETPLVQKPESAAAEATNLASKFRTTPISSIKSAVGLNERFRFANDLFDGNMTELLAALTQFDAMHTIDEALTYVESLKTIYKWDTKTPEFGDLMNLISRRFL